MSANSPLIPVISLTDIQRRWLDFGLISRVTENDEQFVLNSQLSLLDRLSKKATQLNYKNPHPTSLFPKNDEIFLGTGTILIDCKPDDDLATDIDDILYQLLPSWIEEADQQHNESSQDIWGQILLGNIEILTKNSSLIKRIHDAQKNIAHSLDSRTAQFARSASYMGSKSNLAPYFVEILKDLLPQESKVLDLMCGSGASSGVFSNHWKTVATDAQQFSRMLAVVQGGGMDAVRARAVSDKVLSEARATFNKLPDFLKNYIETENNFLSSELSDEVLDEFANWISSFPRINNPHIEPNHQFLRLVDIAKDKEPNAIPILFSAYYGNLFFGIRQAAEIDCLRSAIETITDDVEKHWALGALICSVSSRAYSYGGHFAQPKLDCSDKEKIKKLAPEILVSWGQSVSHEFFVRLTNLGNESTNVLFPIRQIEGPWEEAISFLSREAVNESVCVYLDPPYTRDEYSRYYHVLETLVRYDYPKVHDKPSIPRRGHAGRFASSFATRSTSQVESLIISIIISCLENNWSCLWSYSSSGLASIKNIIENISENCSVDIHMFAMNYSYKAQGKSKKKEVKEHVIFVRKRT